MISHPRKRTQHANEKGNGREDSHSDDCGMVILEVMEDYDHTENEPNGSRNSAARMNTTKMLQQRCAAKAKP
jgi:hypothetical protein